jgi:hypothetical protein
LAGEGPVPLGTKTVSDAIDAAEIAAKASGSNVQECGVVVREETLNKLGSIASLDEVGVDDVFTRIVGTDHDKPACDDLRDRCGRLMLCAGVCVEENRATLVVGTLPRKRAE